MLTSNGLVESTTNQARGDSGSELEQLRLENKHLKEHIRQKDLERQRRAAEVADELERLRQENRQLRAELRQWEKDWDIRIAQEREKIRAEIKAEYQHIIYDMTAKYEAVLARLEAIEQGKK
jgi:serine phosphatase RsbU (regulator of sigma subunit)